jgi:RNA polymerase sigma-70 factor (ECF subfamily)
VRRLLSTMFRGAAEDVEDAEQEILAGLYADLGRFRFQSSFRTYLYRFCRNKAIDLLRSKRREARRREAAFREAAGGNAATRDCFDPEEELSREERRREVGRALMLLREEERLLLLMKDCEGMPVEEIAVILGIPCGTVKSRLHRTREKLAAALEGEMNGRP